MLNLNKIVIGGHLGKDAEVTNFEKGGCVVKFSVASSEKYTKKDGSVIENTTWFNVELFRKTNTVAQYLTKGTPVYVEGKIKNETYDKADGTKGYSTKVLASNIQLLGSKKGETTDTSVTSEENPDEVPF